MLNDERAYMAAAGTALRADAAAPSAADVAYIEGAAPAHDRRRRGEPETVEPNERLRPRTVAELRAAKKPRWLIRNLIQTKTIALIWGASGSGKTFVMWDIGCAIARRIRWFGLRTASDAGGVIYVAGEGHLPRRCDAYMAHNRLDDEAMAGLRVVASSLNLLAAGADLLPLIVQLKRAADEMDGVSLVVLDTLNAMMPGGDENSSEDMGAMISAAKLIAEHLDCAVAYVHHCGKDEAKGARGHGSLKAAVDTELIVRDSDTHRTLRVEKQRDGEADLEFAFKLRPIDLGPSEDPDADPDERDSSCVVEPMEGVPTEPAKKAPKRDVALDALREAVHEHGQVLPGTSAIPPGTKAVGLDRWEARFRLLTGDDYGTDRIAAAAFRRARTKLIEARVVACSGRLAWIA